VDEPTDRSLKLQGLRRGEYDTLSREGKAVISGRSRRIVAMSDISLAAELMITLAEADDPSRAYVAETLDGRHPEFEEKIREVLREYLDSGVETSIRDFYKIKYGKAGIIASAIGKTFIKESLQTETQTAQTRKEPVSVISYLESDEPKKQPQEAIQAAVQERPSQTKPQPAAPDDRRREIAVILSQWEKRDLESVMKTESDIIEAVMKASDEYKDRGVTDEIVCRASETMIRSQTNGVQFYREALIQPNREALLTIAKTYV
jgi:hypothetical protein